MASDSEDPALQELRRKLASVGRDKEPGTMLYSGGAGGAGGGAGVGMISSTGGITAASVQRVQPNQQPSSTPTHGSKRILRISAQKHPTLVGVVICDLCSAIVHDFSQHVRYHESIMHAGGGSNPIFEPFLFDSVIQEEPDQRDLEER